MTTFTKIFFPEKPRSYYVWPIETKGREAKSNSLLISEPIKKQGRETVKEHSLHDRRIINRTR